MAILAVTLVVPSFARPAFAGVPIVRTPAGASYDFHLRSGPTGKSWTGDGSISFTNVGVVPLTEVYLRVWSNGVLGCGAKSIVVSNLIGGTLTDERLACTELEVTLDDPIALGESTAITFDLHIRLPREDDRFGFHRGLALVGTALPTLSVFDDVGWHRAPFEYLGESFYSLAADYEVTFVTPVGLDTAATGTMSERTRVSGGRWRTTYTATQVRDFAWAAGQLRRVVRSARGTDVVLSYQPGAVSPKQARGLASDAIDVVKTLGSAFGDYPYPEVDVVLAGHARFGDMEYPTIVFSGMSRITMAHELAHQWFYGVVGNDQYAEPWLDESFAASTDSSTTAAHACWRTCRNGSAGSDSSTSWATTSHATTSTSLEPKTSWQRSQPPPRSTCPDSTSSRTGTTGGSPLPDVLQGPGYMAVRTRLG